MYCFAAAQARTMSGKRASDTCKEQRLAPTEYHTPTMRSQYTRNVGSIPSSQKQCNPGTRPLRPTTENRPARHISFYSLFFFFLEYRNFNILFSFLSKFRLGGNGLPACSEPQAGCCRREAQLKMEPRHIEPKTTTMDRQTSCRSFLQYRQK